MTSTSHNGRKWILLRVTVWLAILSGVGGLASIVLAYFEDEDWLFLASTWLSFLTLLTGCLCILLFFVRYLQAPHSVQWTDILPLVIPFAACIILFWIGAIGYGLGGHWLSGPCVTGGIASCILLFATLVVSSLLAKYRGSDILADLANVLKSYQWLFSLRTLLFVVPVLGIGIGWFGMKYNSARPQRKAAEVFESLGGTVGTRGVLSRVVFISFLGVSAPITDTDLVHLEGLASLESLDLGGTQITDAGLVHVKGLTNLWSLSLKGTQITDAGLVHLKGLTNLYSLALDKTQITDAGLVHLRGLTKLIYLPLHNTQVTAEGKEKFRQALPECKFRDSSQHPRF